MAGEPPLLQPPPVLLPPAPPPLAPLRRPAARASQAAAHARAPGQLLVAAAGATVVLLVAASLAARPWPAPPRSAGPPPTPGPRPSPLAAPRRATSSRRPSASTACPWTATTAASNQETTWQHYAQSTQPQRSTPRSPYSPEKSAQMLTCSYDTFFFFLRRDSESELRLEPPSRCRPAAAAAGGGGGEAFPPAPTSCCSHAEKSGCRIGAQSRHTPCLRLVDFSKPLARTAPRCFEAVQTMDREAHPHSRWCHLVEVRAASARA